MQDRRPFTALNAGYIEELYERYLRDPESVDRETQEIFKHWQPAAVREETGASQVVQSQPASLEKMVRAVNFANAIRSYGHLKANLYPVGKKPPGDPALDPATYQLDEADLRSLPGGMLSGHNGGDPRSAWEVIQDLLAIYTGTTGYDYRHVEDPREREWLREGAEQGRFRVKEEPQMAEQLLDRLTQVEVFEQFLNRYFPGKTRFSIEGLDILVPMLDETIRRAADAKICMVMLGMAHRGRLNILAHILCKPYSQILAEFRDLRGSQMWENEVGWTGDVKYHKGAMRAVPGEEQVSIVLMMPPNPSHLEHINPVVEGLVRSAQSATNKPGEPVVYPDAALPVLIHGDAAFPGEGVVAETLNFNRLPGYQTAGTIHIISNNQLGFTTAPEQGRSTIYASDLAKGYKIPIIHVNADDPMACLEAVRTAAAYRQEFHKDFMIDLIGYRRYGHNEGDEPGFTQPVLYEEIRAHPSTRALWAEKLVKAGQISGELPQQLAKKYQDALRTTLENLNPEQEMETPRMESDPFPGGVEIERVPVEKLREYNQALVTLPEGFEVNSKLQRGINRRREAFKDPRGKTIEWATAEALAFAAILERGIPIRLTGQDTERGTFSQRHAVFTDTRSGEPYVPLQHLPGANAAFEIANSPLSENAAVGFEYGYSNFDPRRMVIWEAQYGDFINAAQAMVDEFLVSAQAKWEQENSLVLLLPHGYEGQGPDHSSGRMERFLELASSGNMRIANCTSAVQYYHLLRLQAASTRMAPRPLVVFTPKSLLRHPLVASSPEELAEGAWQPVLDDPTRDQGAEQVERVLICSGKIGVDLMDHPLRKENQGTVILRLEQLYPFPEEDLKSLLQRYPAAREWAWVQEEPENMGAWHFVEPRIKMLLGTGGDLKYIGRAVSSSPGEGSFNWHTANQEKIMEQAFGANQSEQVAEERSYGK